MTIEPKHIALVGAALLVGYVVLGGWGSKIAQDAKEVQEKVNADPCRGGLDLTGDLTASLKRCGDSQSRQVARP